jgi:serine-type D-Ala-D-Ala carboxypeptidase/endopeptidase (penicillin-binding protein 4)
VLVQTTFTTDSAGAPRRIRVERVVGSDTLIVWGSIALGASPDTTRLAVGDPARYAAHALAWRMRLRGVAVDTVRVALPGEGAEAEARAAGARTAAAWTSPPLREVIARILGPSQNFMAEQLLKTLGAERGSDGSWAGGIEVETRYLRDVVGIDTLAFRLSDGSGRSVQNLLAPLAVVRLLEHAMTTPWGAAWRAALPGPGESETTLANRLPGLEGRVRAKTGTITNVTSIAGYITTTDGRELIFAILTNGTGVSSVRVRRGIDAIVDAAARQGLR